MRSSRGLRNIVLRQIRLHQLWQPGRTIGVAVSGGMDSIVLLDILVKTMGVHQGQLVVLCVNHCQSEYGSDSLDLVRRTADAHGIPFKSASLDLEPGCSEAAMRDARYAWLFSHNFDCVALGHHQDDLAETVLLQITRGSGLDGFRGMRWRHEGKVRPLLSITRAEILTYATAEQLSWMEDPSNGDQNYTRNKIRHTVLPALEAARPGATQSIARSARLAADEADAIDFLSRQWVAGIGEAISLEILFSMPIAIVRRALRIREPALSSSQIDAILECGHQGSGIVQLDKGRTAKIRNGHLTFE